MARGSGTGVVLKKCECKTKRTCPHGWTLRYYVDGKQREQTFRDTVDGQGHRQYGTGKVLAQDAAAAMFKAKRSADETFADKKLGEVPFIAYCEEWIGRRSPNTRAIYMSTLNRIRKDLAGRTLRQVANDREGAQRLMDAAPDSYKLRTRVVLVSPCNEAQKAGRITGHRLRGLDVEAPAQSAEFDWVERPELEAMAKALGERGLLVWLGRFAGLRLGESLGVNIADFCEGGTMLRVERQRGADGALSGHLKGRGADDFRDIPVPRLLWEKAQAAPRDEDGFLFRKEWRKTVMNAVKKAQKAAGVPESFVPHHLRHMYASELLEDGVPITDVAKFLGHKDVKITFAVYGRHVKNGMDRTRALLDAKWAA
jgi:integrase